ncbi:MAG: hypothetical protein JSS83_26620 [Cyanobacteria bacterium SZAS LIN-3]|nr:hypothetical protein [Cyanobacteria bacterium SZAS LIN-3]
MSDQTNNTANNSAGISSNGISNLAPQLPPAPPPRNNPTRRPQSGLNSAPPGWIFEQPEPITPADARKRLEGKVFDESKIYKKSAVQGFASNTVQGPASIVELARALKNDPQLIFEFVYNNIDWEPNWGVNKGAFGCLQDGTGNAFDQSMLLVALLRQAGFTANYVLGNITLSDTQFNNWFGTSDAIVAYYYASNSNIPADFPVYPYTSMNMSHVWVEVVVNGTTYSLDPSYKQYTRKSPLANLGTVLGYNQATFLSNAQSGATVTTDYVQNMNTKNIASDLTTMTSNLISYINGNTIGSAAPGTATVDDILGGWEIVPITLPFAWNTSLPYEKVGDVPTRWTGDVPLAYKTEILVQYWGGTQYPYTDTPQISQTFTSDQLSGGRLTLTYDGSLFPVLTLDGTVVATGATAGVALQPGAIGITATHNAYSGYFPLAVHFGIYPNSYYLVGTAFGNVGRGSLDYHSRKNLAAQVSTTATNEEKIGEKLACIWYSLNAQSTRVGDLVGRIQKTHMNFFHQCGVVSYYIDPWTSIPTAGTNVGLVQGWSSTLDGVWANTYPTNTVVAMHGVALEAAVLAQFNGKTPGVSTTTVVDKANRTANVLIGGTITAGDVLTVTVNDTALSGGAHSVNYTVLLGDTLTTAAAGLAAALNADTTLAPLGIHAGTVSPLILLSSTSANQTTYTSSTSGGATETISISWEKLYLVTSSNWTTGANISATLSANGYAASDITAISDFLATGNDNVLVPERPGLTLGDWIGEGYWVMVKYTANGGALGLINNTLKGGSGQGGDSDFIQLPFGLSGRAGLDMGGQPPTGEPIGFYTGDFFYVRTDITIGSQGFPYGLAFGRSYNSRNQNVSGILGLGWTHNHAITATTSSNGLMALGDQFAVQGAAALCELYVASDLASDAAQPIPKLVTISLADKWFFEQLVNNVVVVSTAGGVGVFVRQPNGNYTAPAQSPSKLTTVFGNFKLVTPQGITMNFNGSGQLVNWVHPRGVTVTYTYSGGLLSTISNGLGRTLTLNYISGKLASVSDGTGRSVHYTFDLDGNLSSFTNASSEAMTYEYDQPGRMAKFYMPQNPAVPVVTNVYDTLGRIKSQGSAAGQIWSYYFAGSRSEELDALGQAKVAYFNKFGLPVRLINALGLEMSFKYDGLNRITDLVKPEGNRVLYTYDLFNNVLTSTFIPKPGSVLSPVQIVLTYDALWNKIKSVQKATGDTTNYSYDATSGNLLTITQSAVGGISPITAFTYNARGQIVSTTNPIGMVTQYVYDPVVENLLSETVDFSVSPGHLNLLTELTYDSVGNVQTVTDPNGNLSTWTFDSKRQQIAYTSPAPFNYVSKFTYDFNGNVTSIQKQVSSTPSFKTTTLTYNVSDQVQTVVSPTGSTTTYFYDEVDRVRRMVNSKGETYNFVYDGANRIKTILDSSSLVSSGKTYSDNGLPSSVIDAQGSITAYTYDGFDRLITTTYADTTSEQNTLFNESGKVLSIVKRSGDVISMTYDALGRMSTRTVGVSTPITTTFQYDLSGKLVDVSKPVIAGDPATGHFQFRFDSAGRFYQEICPDSKTITHDLDNNGNRIKTTWPDGYFVERRFDSLNRVTDILLNGSSSSAVVFSHDQLSRRTGMTFQNGVTTNYSYSLSNELLQLQQVFPGSAETYVLAYDSTHRLVGRRMTDGAFNWHPTVAGTTVYGGASPVHTYPWVGSISTVFSYDGNKNLTSDGTWTFGYDIDGHLLNASNGLTSASYTYDSIGRQTKKNVGGTVTRFVYDGQELIATYDTAGNLVSRYIYGLGLDEPIIEVKSTGAIVYLHANEKGSIVATSNTSGVVTNVNSYGPFGESNTVNGTIFGYTGQRFDAETGLYYYKARYYSPTLGRFLQPDPIGYAGGDLNLYAYVQNDPINWTDSTGLTKSPQVGDTVPGPGPAGSKGSGLIVNLQPIFGSDSLTKDGPNGLPSAFTSAHLQTTAWDNSNPYLDTIYATETVPETTPLWDVWVSQDKTNGFTHQILTVGNPLDRATWVSIGFSGCASPTTWGQLMPDAFATDLAAQLLTGISSPPLPGWKEGVVGVIRDASEPGWFNNYEQIPIRYVAITPEQGAYYRQTFQAAIADGQKTGWDYVFNVFRNNCQVFSNNALKAISEATGSPIMELEKPLPFPLP